MQILFAKILAGEVKKPGSFSIRTIEFINTLTTEEATFIYNACRYIVYSQSPLIHPFGDLKNPAIFTILPKKSKITGKGQSIFEIDQLFHLGILAGESKKIESSNPSTTLLPLYRGNKAILLQGNALPLLNFYSVTTLGKELLQLSDIDTETFNLAEDLATEFNPEIKVRLNSSHHLVETNKVAFPKSIEINAKSNTKA